jgi:hypothetical protein
LNGGWLLNHYGGKEGFLGWRAIQPIKHRMAFHQLSSVEAKWFGSNIKVIETALRAIWKRRFRADPIERLYLAYFRESSGYHLHAHLVPRTRRMAPILKKLSAHGTVDAWRTPCLSSHPLFPNHYKNSDRGYRSRVKSLMSDLQKFINGGAVGHEAA